MPKVGVPRALVLLVFVLVGCNEPPAPKPITDLALPRAQNDADVPTPPADPTPPPGPSSREEDVVDPVAVAPPPIRPAERGATGRLVFQSDRDGLPKLYELDVAGRSVRALSIGHDWRDETPQASPDGRFLAFSSNRYHRNVLELAVLDLESGEVRRLTHFADDPANVVNERHAMDPAWSPDGWVYFAWGRERQEDIYRVQAAGGTPEQVTDTFMRAIMPAVSPDGKQLAYAAQSVRKLGGFQVEILDLSTRQTRVVETAGGACRPAWSPDGRRLAYVALDEEPSTIDILDLESGATERLLAGSALWAYYPSFSPDGRYLSLSLSPAHHEGEDWDLALVDLARPDRFVRLTSGPGNDRLADWR